MVDQYDRGMSRWLPWDVDEEELEDLQVIRELIPDSMRAGLLEWLRSALVNFGNSTAESKVNMIQTALDVNFRFAQGSVNTADFVEAISDLGDKFTLRVLDLILTFYDREHGSMPDQVAVLKWHLDTAMSAVAITYEEGKFRLTRRLPDGIELAAQEAVNLAPTMSGKHLANALVEARSLEPNTSLVMAEAIKAVEAAAGAVVTPKEKPPRLGKIVQALRDKSAWTLAFRQRDDKLPDQRAFLIGMLETLAFAQPDRHSGFPPSVVEAQGHAMLAANLVLWFSTGVVQMNESSR